MREGTGAALLLAAVCSAARGASLVRYVLSSGYCFPGTDILDAETCRAAAAELVYPFGATVSLDGGHRHCYVGADRAVYYNSVAVYDAWPTPPNSRLRPICMVEGGPQWWLLPTSFSAHWNSWSNRLVPSAPWPRELTMVVPVGAKPPELVTSSNGGALKNVTALRGEKGTIMRLGAILPSNFTLCSLTRLTEHSKGMILRGAVADGTWHHGHMGGVAGSVHYGSAANKLDTGESLTPNSTDWIALCAKNDQTGADDVFLNGRSVGTVTADRGAPPSELMINSEADTAFEIAELLIWPRHLPRGELLEVSDYLMSQLGRRLSAHVGRPAMVVPMLMHRVVRYFGGGWSPTSARYGHGVFQGMESSGYAKASDASINSIFIDPIRAVYQLEDVGRTIPQRLLVASGNMYNDSANVYGWSRYRACYNEPDPKNCDIRHVIAVSPSAPRFDSAILNAGVDDCNQWVGDYFDTLMYKCYSSQDTATRCFSNGKLCSDKNRTAVTLSRFGWASRRLNLRGQLARGSEGTQGLDEPVDGVVSPTNFKQAECGHFAPGNSSSPAWWAVDFGEDFHIISIQISSIKDCCSDRLADVKVHLDSGVQWPEAPTRIETITLNQFSPTIVPAIPAVTSGVNLTGRYLRIERAGNLSLCEVVVAVADEVATAASPVSVGEVCADGALLWEGAAANCKMLCEADARCGSFVVSFLGDNALSQCSLYTELCGVRTKSGAAANAAAFRLERSFFPKTCPAPLPPTNGAGAACATPGDIADGGRCEAICAAGFVPSVPALFCEAGALWPPTFRCLSQCKLPSSRMCEEGSLIVDTNCTTKCSTGLASVASLTCSGDVLTPPTWECYSSDGTVVSSGTLPSAITASTTSAAATVINANTSTTATAISATISAAATVINANTSATATAINATISATATAINATTTPSAATGGLGGVAVEGPAVAAAATYLEVLASVAATLGAAPAFGGARVAETLPAAAGAVVGKRLSAASWLLGPAGSVGAYLPQSVVDAFGGEVGLVVVEWNEAEKALSDTGVPVRSATMRLVAPPVAVRLVVDGAYVGVKDLQEPILVKVLSDQTAAPEAVCVYWDEDAGDWSTSGLVERSGEDGAMICATPHLTLFGAAVFLQQLKCTNVLVFSKDGVEAIGRSAWVPRASSLLLLLLVLGSVALVAFGYSRDLASARRQLWRDADYVTDVPEQLRRPWFGRRYVAALFRQGRGAAAAVFRRPQIAQMREDASLAAAQVGVHAVLSDRHGFHRDLLNKHVWGQRGWVQDDLMRRRHVGMSKAFDEVQTSVPGAHKTFFGTGFCMRAWLVLRNAHPIMQVAHFTSELSAAKRAKLICDGVWGGLFVSTLFFSGSGATSLSSPEECRGSGLHLARFVLIGVGSALLVKIPLALVAVYNARHFVHNDEWGPKTAEKLSRYWKAKDVVFWTTGCSYSTFFLFYVLGFLANMSDSDEGNWIVMYFTILLRLLVVWPVAFALGFAALAGSSLAHGHSKLGFELPEIVETHPKVKELGQRGISVGALLDFYELLGKDVMPHFDLAKSTTNDVVRHAVIPLSWAGDEARGVAYSTKVMTGELGLAHKMVTHNWGNKFGNLLAAVFADCLGYSTYDAALEMLATPKGAARLRELLAPQIHSTYWICAFCVNQHCTICGWAPSKLDSQGKEFAFCPCPTEKHTSGDLCEVNKFDDMMAFLKLSSPGFEQVVAMDDDFVLFTRIWCIAELLEAHNSGIPQTLKIRSRKSLDAHREELKDLDVACAKASFPADRDLILAKIDDKDEFNKRLRDLVLNPSCGLLAVWSASAASGAAATAAADEAAAGAVHAMIVELRI